MFFVDQCHPYIIHSPDLCEIIFYITYLCPLCNIYAENSLSLLRETVAKIGTYSNLHIRNKMAASGEASIYFECRRIKHRHV